MFIRWPFLLLPFREAERDDAFRDELTRLARIGVRVGAVLGGAAVVLFVATHGVVLGRSLSWSYAADVNGIGLADKAVMLGLCVLALVAAPRLWLGQARLLMAVLVLLAAFASVGDDVLAGDVSFAPGYLTFMYLMAAVTVPYRPVHTLALGGALAGVLYLALAGLPGVLGVASVEQHRGHYVYMAVITLLMTGLSALLYSSRLAQYRARREAEGLRQQVEALEQSKSRFFADLSHELRGPLTVMLGPLEGALQERYGPLTPPLRRRMEDVHTHARRLRRLVNQILDLARLEAERMPLRAAPQDLAAFVRHQAALFRSAADQRGITLDVDVPEEPLTVWFDRERMEDVVTNLLTNALKFTPEQGRVRVRVGRGEEHARLSVRDSGPGIPEDMLEHVFDRFVGSEAALDGQPSTGIGLALVRELVERHGGHVEARSEPGFGAELRVQLPLGPDHLAEDDRAPMPAPPSEASVPPIVLAPPAEGALGAATDEGPLPDAGDRRLDVVVADDDATVRAYLQDLLGTTYRVRPAADGEEALALIHEQRPALVISDVTMPRLDGIALCRRIKHDDALKTLPVVLLTARASDEARLDGLRTGADAYLTKPFAEEELLVMAENMIEVRRVLQARVKVPDWMAAHTPEVPSHEAEFLDRVQRAVLAHLGDSSFGVEWLASEVGLSARQLQRRLKALTSLTAAAFIKTMRFERAAQLLRESDLQVQEVAAAVGYEDASYFSRLFRQAYGVPPSVYAEEASERGA